eukprot:TRINITY_DN4307_c0_g1_i1.p1 TRINITY_DN4307_c0_g1~~TRINITY_DN4307_c0_g1_i1.p1  ORF type:complete len:241 (-),score=45.95 TRINITY_DN4307_c0_g1_i1:95-763(-)
MTGTTGGEESQPLIVQDPPVEPFPSGPVLVYQQQQAIVPCRVCNNPITYIPGPQLQGQVRCNLCSHGTQVGPPPPGKSFMICACNRMLSFNSTFTAVTCPGADCKRTVILGPIREAGKQRCFCPTCNTLLKYNSTAAQVICPKCRQRAIISSTRLRVSLVLMYFIAIVFIALGLGMGLFMWEEFSIVWLFWGIVLSGIITLIRAIMQSVYACNAKHALHVGV